MVEVVHGGTTLGVSSTHDCSTNSNAFGPNPIVVDHVNAAALDAYPEPTYSQLREQLGAIFGVHHDRIVIGAGASELISRIIGVHQGDVIVPPHTFGEYAAAASRAHRRTVETSWDSWNQPLVPGSVEFLCIPNNPTGYELSSEEVRRRVDARSIAGSQVVLDLAYAPFLDHKVLVPEEAIVLYSPNKVHGMTGIRAAFLVAPLAAAQRLAHAAPSWVTGAHGVAMLAAIYHNEAQAWVESTTAKLRQERLLLTQSLIRAGFEVKESGANFLMIRVGDAALVRSTLLSQSIHVRDCSSFGLPEWIRVSAGKSERNTALVAAMCSLREDDMWAH